MRGVNRLNDLRWRRSGAGVLNDRVRQTRDPNSYSIIKVVSLRDALELAPLRLAGLDFEYELRRFLSLFVVRILR